MLGEMIQKVKAKIANDNFRNDRRGQGAVTGLLGLIAIGSVGAIILGVIFSSVLSTSIYNANSTFLTIQNDMIPLFALAIVGGSVVGALLVGFLAFGAGRR